MREWKWLRHPLPICLQRRMPPRLMSVHAPNDTGRQWGRDIGVLVLAGVLSFGIAALSGAVNWSFQFTCVGMTYAAAGWWVARGRSRPFVRALLVTLPWLLSYGLLSFADGQLHVYPIALVGPAGALAGARLAVVAGEQTRKAVAPTLALVALLVLGGWIGMPNWLAIARGISAAPPAVSDETVFTFHEGPGAAAAKPAPDAFRGRVTVLDFWTTSCGACFARFPELDNVHASYADDPRVSVYAVNLTLPEDPEGRAEAMMRRYEYGFTTLYSDLSFEAARSLYGFRGVPSVAVYDSEGALAFVGSPQFNPLVLVNNVDRIVQELLDETEG